MKPSVLNSSKMCLTISYIKAKIKSKSKERSTLRFFLTFAVFLVLRTEIAGGVKINEHLAQSLCTQVKTFASTKTVQPPLNDPTKFEKQAQCKMLSWSKCESNAGSSCQKFGSPQDSTQCGGGGGSKKVKISIRKNMGDGPVLKKRYGYGYSGEENTEDPYPPEENTEDPYPPEENTDDPYLPEEITDDPYPSEENTEDPYKPEEITEDPYPSEENTEDPYLPEENTEDPYPPEENTDDPYPPEENTEDPYNGGGYGYKKNGRELPKLEQRIVGGRDAGPNEFPHQVRLYNPNKHMTFCGGTIIDKYYILSAAHCFQRGEELNMKIYIGDLSVDKKDPFEKEIKMKELMIHEDYNDPPFLNDIALIKVSEPMSWSAGVKPALLPKDKKKPKGFATVTGWGYLYDGRTDQPDILQKVQVPILENSVCRKSYQDKMILLTRLCAGLVNEGGAGACKGDSGGPLVQKAGSDFLLIGIVSTGAECGKGKPGIYTDVAQFGNWIYAKMHGLIAF